MRDRILVIYESAEGQTASIVKRVATRLVELGFNVMVFRGKAIPRSISPAGFDGVIIAAPVRYGRHSRHIRKFVRRYAEPLNDQLSAFLSVSCAAASPQPEGPAEALDRIRAFLAATGWLPRHSLALGGALMYLKYGPITRRIMRSIARKTGLDTDTSRNHEYTDWAAVDRFTDAFAEELDRPTAVAEPVTTTVSGVRA